MKLTERPYYARKLANVMGTPDIKVITGIRGSGKTALLQGFMQYAAESVPDANIIHVDFDQAQSGTASCSQAGTLACIPKEYHALHDFIEGSYKKGCRNFVFIDEVQLCPKFELAVNSLHASEKYDIYITGSNAFLMDSDLATLLTGRTFAINVFPFSFAEFRRFFEPDDAHASSGICPDTCPDICLDRYMQAGGLPGSYRCTGQDAGYAYVRDIFETLLARDVRQRHRIRHAAVPGKIARYMADNIAGKASAKDVAAMLADSHENIGPQTAARYMDYLCQAFALYKIPAYDIRSKRRLNSGARYFLCDHSFHNAFRCGKTKTGQGTGSTGQRVLENIIAIDLVRRGYEVCTGVLHRKKTDTEISFVAMRRNEKMYIQVSGDISDDKAFKRETSSLLQIRDAYPKIILARTRHPRCQYEGIQIIDIADWLCLDNVYPMR